MTTEEQNDGAMILSIIPDAEGIEVQVSFPIEARASLSRAHSFHIGFDHEEFGLQAREIVELSQDLSFEVLHGYPRQPK